MKNLTGKIFFSRELLEGFSEIVTGAFCFTGTFSIFLTGSTGNTLDKVYDEVPDVVVVAWGRVIVCVSLGMAHSATWEITPWCLHFNKKLLLHGRFFHAGVRRVLQKAGKQADTTHEYTKKSLLLGNI